MYTTRIREECHVSIPFIMEIMIQRGFGDKIKVFNTFLEKLFCSSAADVTVVDQISNIVAVLLWMPC